MRKTYKSSNVRFCMEDKNQRRTWEYLQSLTRKDSSYGKALSDAFVLVLDGKVPKGDAGEAEEPCFSLLNAKKALSEENIPSDKVLSEGAFCRNEQSAMEILQWQTMTLAEWHQPRRAPTFDTQCQR